MRALSFAVIVAAAMICLGAAPSITVTDAWSRATYGAGATAVGYLVITGGGAADRLTGASCAGAATTMIHQTEPGMSMGGMSMEHMAAMDGVAIPARGSVAFRPGGLHLMLMDTTRQLHPGDHVDCTLNFTSAGDVLVRLSVQRAGDTAYAPP